MSRTSVALVAGAAALLAVAAIGGYFLLDGSAEEPVVAEPSASPTVLPTVQLGPATLRMEVIGASPEDLKSFLADGLLGQMFQALSPYPGGQIEGHGALPAVHQLVTRMEKALLYCRQVESDVFRELPAYREAEHEGMLIAFDETCDILDAAGARFGTPLDNRVWRAVQRQASEVVKPRPDWATDSISSRDHIAFNLREVGEFVYHTLRGYMEGPAYCAGLGPPRSVTLGCATRLDFPQRVASVIGKCSELFSREAITESTGYQPAVHEPVATAIDAACRLLEAAYLTAGYPQQDQLWESLVTRVLEILDSGLK
jgi:hypothetical protein